MEVKYDIVEELKEEEKKGKLNLYTKELDKNQKKANLTNEKINIKKHNKKIINTIFNTNLKSKQRNHKSEELKRNQKLLVHLIYVLIFFNILFLILLTINPNYFALEVIDPLILITTLLLLISMLFTSYLGYYTVSSIFLVLFTSGLIIFHFTNGLISLELSQLRNISFSLVYLVIPILLSSFLLRKKYTIIMITMNSIVIISLPIILNRASFYEYLINPFSFYFFISFILLYFKYHTEKNEFIRSKKLIQAKKETEDILDVAADGIRIIDKNFNIINANNTMARIAGISKNKMIGKSCMSSFGSDIYCGTKECSLKKVIENGEEFSRVSTRFKNDGTEIICFEQVKPWKNENDELIGILEDFQDITELKHVEKRLEQEKNKAQKYLDIASVILFVLDKNGNISLINKKGCELLQFKEEDLVGKNWFEKVYPKDFVEKQKNQFNNYVKKQNEFPKNKILPIITKTGEQRFVQWNVTPLIDESDKIIGIVGSGIDLTEEIRAKDAKEIADTILEKRGRAFRILYDTVLQIEQSDRDKIYNILCKNLVKITNTELAFFGVYSREKGFLICKNYSINSDDDKNFQLNENKSYSVQVANDLLKDIFIKQIKKYQNLDDIKFLLPRNLYDKYTKYNKKDCNYYLISYPINHNVVLIGIVYMENGKKLQMKDMIEAYMNLSGLIYQRNQSVLDLERSENRYKDLSNQLERKVIDRTSFIERLLKQKEEFIYQLGHDLKTPLTPLTNLIPLLRKKNNDPECRKILDILERNTGHMKNLVTKTLELAQLNSPTTMFSFKKVNLFNEIKEILQKNKYMFEHVNINVSTNISENIYVEIDELRFTELIDNLLTNAIKYSPNGGDITLEGFVENDMLTISINDTGIGMSINQIEHIFDEFYKADGARHDFDSSGLGMSICKKIIEKHNGKIWVESKGIGHGTKIYFSIPLEQNNS